MTGDELRDARTKLGEMHDLGRPYRLAEFGRLLGLAPKSADDAIRKWERGDGPGDGPAGRLILAMLATGYRPE